jgi:hypothetical protein
MKIEIIKIDGKWLINGKPYGQVSDEEKQFFDEFLLFMKWEQGKEEHDSKLKKAS